VTPLPDEIQHRETEAREPGWLRLKLAIRQLRAPTPKDDLVGTILLWVSEMNFQCGLKISNQPLKINNNEQFSPVRPHVYGNHRGSRQDHAHRTATS
jgi:hypothetical protein